MRIKQSFKNKFSLNPNSMSSVAYSDDGKTWRWESNDSVIMVATCDDYSIPCDREAQAKAYSEWASKVIAEYRNRPRTHEELNEMRAAFGTGKTVVDILTGEKFKT